LEGKPDKITDTNFTRLEQLCAKLGFEEVAAKFAEFRRSMGLNVTENLDVHGRIAALDGRAEQHDRGSAAFQDKIMQLVTDLWLLAGEVSSLQSDAVRMQLLFGEICPLKPQIAVTLPDSVVEQFSTELCKLRRAVSTLKSQITAMPRIAAPNHPALPPPDRSSHNSSSPSYRT
jgi:hypothetical protein